MAEIIIPFFNKHELLFRCLDHLLSATGKRNRIILVDDGSELDELSAVEKYCTKLEADLQLVSHQQNKGYKESICTGLQECKQKYVILLNNDTVVTPDFDLRLIEVMVQNASIRAVAPISNHPTDLFQYRESLYDLTTLDGDALAHQVSLVFSQTSHEGKPKLSFAPYLTGMCLALDRQTFEEAGIFGADYQHGYFEDLALSCRIRSMGFKLAVREDCFVYHQGHATYRDKSREEKQQIIFHNFRIFSSEWGHLPEHGELLQKMDYAGKVSPI
ncbi:MAG TPA: glycosyltransferase [Pyrinomonadaceae bacterium]|jgi:GT2 family glycosyltransferase|nr:glycosyltransferase [Pyrinomonadaceae bacterium]